MKECAISIVVALVLFALGTAGLFWPDKLRQYGLKGSDRGLGRFNPFLNWMKTPGYLLYLRTMGALFLFLGLFAIVAGLMLAVGR
jgi:hypothetical protein